MANAPEALELAQRKVELENRDDNDRERTNNRPVVYAATKERCNYPG